jgi:2'-5' RNA ligase
VRLFVALEIPTAVRDNLATLIKDLSALAQQSGDNRARWVRPENLHVTLKFIGEAAPEKLEAIRNALSTVHCDQPVELRFRGLGFFPDEKHPRVFWAGMEASPNLKSLVTGIDQALEKLGIPREQRAFTAHLTLARFQPSGMPEKLRAAVHENTARDFGSLRTGDFHLYESKLKPAAAEHTRLQSFLFAGEGS